MNLKFLNFFSHKSRHQKMLDLLKFYWTDKKNPNKNELNTDLVKLGFDNKEAEEIADKFFSEALLNKGLNEEIIESTREQIKTEISQDIKNINGKDISDNLSNELFDALKNEQIDEYNEKHLPFLKQFLKPLIQAFIEDPMFVLESLKDNNHLDDKTKDLIPKEATYLGIYSLIYFSPTLKKINEKYNLDDINSIYPELIQSAFSEFNFYFKNQKLNLIEYQLCHTYYEGCLNKINAGEDKIDKLASSFMMKLFEFKTDDLNLENNSTKEQLLWIYNFAKRVIELVIDAYAQVE